MFKNVLVGLDLSDLDETLMNFVSFITQSDRVEEINFVYILKEEEFPEALKSEFPDLKEKTIDEKKRIIQSEVDKYLPDVKQKIDIIVKTGSIGRQMLNIIDIKDIDLIILGRREKSKQSGMLAQRLARRAACALLIIPEDTKPSLERILVPIDFSEYSKLALEKAIDIASVRTEKPQVLCMNVYKVPAGYHYTGKSFKEVAERMKKNARMEFKKFIHKIDKKEVPLKDLYDLDDNNDFTTNIVDVAKNKKADLVVIGAKGRTVSTAFFLGSIAEKLIQLDSDFPLLVMRYKGRNAGFLEFFREL
ncbi:universal stress protein [Roseivirga sp. BDSF3-8]|uniref:universal stress protein n=1 Tax=Roseivirga sp. BDSF3-8 TaxID=3241598 RepID=UPI0035321AF5